MSVVALALAAGADYPEACCLANHAAGIVIREVGTATCSPSQLIESLEDPLLDEFYRSVEQALPADASAKAARVKEEVALFRGQGGRSTVSFAAIVGRRREPGEKPPAARSE